MEILEPDRIKVLQRLERVKNKKFMNKVKEMTKDAVKSSGYDFDT